MKTRYTSKTAQKIADALRIAARQYKQDAETIRKTVGPILTAKGTNRLVEAFNNQEREAYEMASLLSDCDGFSIEFEDLTEKEPEDSHYRFCEQSN